MLMTEVSLADRNCVPCEGGVPTLSPAEAERMLADRPGWTLIADGKAIQRKLKVRSFRAALDFFQRVGTVAEAEQHHPDLHLTGYRNVKVELTTHAIGGLSENDFILAAKIDRLPVELAR